MRPNIPMVVVAAALAAPVAINATEQRVGVDAQKGDPIRWEEPITTLRQRNENRNKEAVAALAEALKECRGSQDRKACVAEAREQYRHDRVSAAADAK